MGRVSKIVLLSTNNSGAAAAATAITKTQLFRRYGILHGQHALVLFYLL